MRVAMGMLLALAGCSAERQAEEQSAAPAAAVEIPVAAPVVPASTPLMDVPKDPEVVKRLEAMGYTVHAEEGHLHPPGVTSCPKMDEGPVM